MAIEAKKEFTKQNLPVDVKQGPFGKSTKLRKESGQEFLMIQGSLWHRRD
jgi:hypothetical protein